MIKIKKIRKHLKEIHENELSFLKINLFQKTIITGLNKTLIPKHKMFAINGNEYIYTTEQNSTYLKVNVKSKKLLKDRNNKGNIKLSVDYIFKNYVKFKLQSKKDDFFKHLDLTYFLLRKKYISENNILTINVWTIDFAKNEFNEKSLAKDWKEINNLEQEKCYGKDENGKIYWWLNEDTLKNEIKTSKLGRSLNSDWIIYDNLINELLFKGNQKIRISYCKINTELTEKGYEYLKSGFLKTNWKWLITTLIALIAIVVSILAYFA